MMKKGFGFWVSLACGTHRILKFWVFLGLFGSFRAFLCWVKTAISRSRTAIRRSWICRHYLFWRSGCLFDSTGGGLEAFSVLGGLVCVCAAVCFARTFSCGSVFVYFDMYEGWVGLKLFVDTGAPFDVVGLWVPPWVFRVLFRGLLNRLLKCLI
jgi:hypothetical protein